MHEHETSTDTGWVEDEIDLRDYLAVLHRWLWLLVLVPLLAATTGFVYCQTQPVIYRATARLLVQEKLAEVATRITSEELRTTQSLASTYAEMLRARSALNAALVELGMEPLSPQEPSPVELRVSAVGDTHLLEVSVDSSSPDLAVAIASSLPDVFVRQQAQLSSAQFSDAEEAYKAELAEIAAETSRIQLELDALGDSDELRRIQLEDQLSQYMSLSAQMRQMLHEIALAQSRALPPVVVLERPETPLPEVGPRTAVVTFVAGTLGIIAAVFLAFLLEFLGDRFRDSTEVERLLGLPVLAATPFLRQSRSGRGAGRAALAPPRSPTAEAYRVLRSNLGFAAIDRPVPSLTVSSAEPDAGKTTTVANLGLAMAQAGTSVVLVEADLRRPALVKLLGLPRGAMGVTDVVLGTVSLTDCLQEVMDWPGYLPGGLRVLPAGRQLPPGPTELLESRRMGELIDELTALADVVIFDSPPVLSSADAAILSVRTGGMILVIDMRSTKRRVAVQALESLARAKPRLLGAVLTRVPSSAGYYAYYAYGSTGPRYHMWVDRILSYGVAALLILVAAGMLVTLGPHYYDKLLARPTPTATSTATPMLQGPVAAPSPARAASATPVSTSTSASAVATTPPAAVQATYVVKDGDTLTKIADRHGVNVRDLIELNGISRPDSIAVGMVLAVPSPIPGTPTAVIEPS